jgi:hypothetical protein
LLDAWSRACATVRNPDTEPNRTQKLVELSVNADGNDFCNTAN